MAQLLAGSTTVTVKYDPFGRRFQKGAPATTNYLYDGANLAEEIDNSGNVLARYTFGQKIDEPLTELRSGTTSYYQADAFRLDHFSDKLGSIAYGHLHLRLLRISVRVHRDAHQSIQVQSA